MAAAAPRLVAFLRERQIDVVHTNDARMHLTWGLAAKMAGARFVWHQRSAERSRRLAIYSRLANAVLTVSEFCKSQLTPSMSRRASVVLNPFDPTPTSFDRVFMRGRLLAELAVRDEHAKIISFVSHLTPRKRPLIFIRMAGRLVERMDRLVVFPMFGDPREPMREECDRLINSLGLRDRCKLMGARFPIQPWMAASDIVVAPAVAEPFGRGVVEPTLLGTPVIAADDGGNREIIADRETGLLVKPDDPSAFADAVTELLDRPDFATELAENALRRAQVRFSEEEHVRKVLRVYKDLRRCGGLEPNGGSTC